MPGELEGLEVRDVSGRLYWLAADHIVCTEAYPEQGVLVFYLTNGKVIESRAEDQRDESR